MLTREERIQKIKMFQAECSRANFKELAPHVYELPGPFSKKLTLCTLIHGNEIGGMEIFLQLLEEINSKKLIPKSNLRLMMGNVDAYLEDKRYLESDLNRSFDLEKHKNKEEMRAKELENFLHDSDVFIDFHQTIGPTGTPFFIFEFEEKSYHLARFLHQTLPTVTNSKERAFKGKTSTAFAINQGSMGITLETGQKGIEATQINLGLEIARKAVVTDFEKQFATCPIHNTYIFAQIIHNPDGSLELIKKYNNFDPVKKGEVLAKNSEKEIHSEVDGVILFPKYGAYAKASLELALILKPVHAKDDI